MSWRIDGRGILRWEPWERYAWLRHGFSTRAAGDFRDLPPENVPPKFGAEGFRAVSVRQIHSDIVRRVSEAAVAVDPPLGGDALIGEEEDRLLGVRTADCGAVLLVDPPIRAVAAVHAGWRGAAAEIVGQTVRRMIFEYGCRPERMEALIGPCIGAGRYEVGEEVAEKFDPAYIRRPDGAPRPFLDLAGANRAQLLAEGLPTENIVSAGMCTHRREELFFSHRRDGAAAGRMLSVIGVASGSYRD